MRMFFFTEEVRSFQELWFLHSKRAEYLAGVRKKVVRILSGIPLLLICWRTDYWYINILCHHQ
ncbi:hypothetical protein QW060_19620 [Myroides ceti]|uniref:Uncharacterized protein n=1 Tax=Paenimyroides ceti TaxID=395087 RepID=A0ABT8CXJ5_9FLAO|nr:hypothetical protein [Paenimyroides ceti]MDN3709235.1 hypothetical protein [Paenimyroides ceti]